jgi:hypothetical protein
MTTITTYIPDVRYDMLTAMHALGEDDESVLRRMLNNSEHLQCNDTLMAFTLQHLFEIVPICLYGRPKTRHYFIHSQVVAAELKRFDRFCADPETDTMNRFEQRERIFQFEPHNMRFSSLYTLQCALAGNCRRSDGQPGASLAYDTVIDSLYFPIYAANHCSILIFSVPRRVAMHLDSMRNELHRTLAMRLLKMLLAAKLLEKDKFRLDIPLTLQQYQDWECGWCALLYAQWWRVGDAETDIRAVINVPVTREKILELVDELLEVQQRRKKLVLYGERLQRSFHVLLDRPKESAVNK